LFAARAAFMFDHEDIEKYEIEDIPRDRDIFLMDEKWSVPYERALLKLLSGGEYEYVGYISYACVRNTRAEGLEISWYPNIHDRFHEMRVFLPKSAFVTCVGSRTCDERPHIFVKSDWLTDLHLRTHSVFALMDAVGVRKALREGAITTQKLDDLRTRIDEIADAHPQIAFVSFADSLLLKANWTVGQWDHETGYTYEPERIVRVLPSIAQAYREALNLKVYGVIAQGHNAFYRNELMHRSEVGNHVSLNSLGLPFAQVQAIESAARAAIRLGEHEPAELYMDDRFFHSLKWRYGFNKNAERSFPYLAPMSDEPCHYVPSSFDRVMKNLEDGTSHNAIV
jgi:hypothetical protein